MKDKNKQLIIRIVLTIIFALIVFYITLPPLNIHDASFWFYLLFIFVFYKFIGLANITSVRDFIVTNTNDFRKQSISVLVVMGIFVLIVLTNIIVSPLFNAKSYSKRITIDESKTFTDDISEVNFNALPLLDKDSSQKLGDRVMGQMPELVSQFSVSDLYTQINYNNDIIRVTPLEYASIIKWFTNRSDGVKGYITVNSVNGEANLIKLDKGMKYMPSALFNEKLERKLRFSYPTEIFDEANFEIDNEGNPYWIVPTVTYKGVGVKKEITGVIILDPITGSSKKYKVEDVPTWVDHVYKADLIIEQVDDWGQYQDGYLNSIFGQKGVVMTTEGYNYTVMNDDVYLYTGITSVVSDESNIGFILCNMRTKETHFYSVAGAKEYSAMDSAEGQVQQMKYESSFPLLINLNGKPTYLMSLKDNAGLVKMYAFVDVADYQKVVVTDSSLGIETAANNYLTTTIGEYSEDTLVNKDITISKINMALINGNSYYYIIDTNGQKYKVLINVGSDILPFLDNGSVINISYAKEEEIIDILKIN